MNFFALISLSCVIIVFVFGIIVYQKNTKNRLNLLFFLFSISVSYMAFAEFALRISLSYEESAFWIRYLCFWPFSQSFQIHFCMILTQKTELLKKKFTYFLIYFPAIFFSLIGLVTDYFGWKPLQVPWGWTWSTGNSIINNLSILWGFFVSIPILYFYFKFYFILTVSNTKKQIKSTIIGVILPLTFGGIFDFFLPSIGIIVPSMINIGYVIGCIVFGIAIVRYGLFLSPEYKALFKSMLSGFAYCNIIYDKKGNPYDWIFQELNDSFLDLMFCSDPYQVKGKTMRQITVPVIKEFSNSFLNEKNFHNFKNNTKLEFYSKLKNKWYSIVIYFPKREDFAILIHDITEEKHNEQMQIEIKKSEEEVRKINQDLADYVYKISHDLKTPLTTISNFFSMLIDRNQDWEINEKSLHYINRIETNIKEMRELIISVFENYDRSDKDILEIY